MDIAIYTHAQTITFEPVATWIVATFIATFIHYLVQNGTLEIEVND